MLRKGLTSNTDKKDKGDDNQVSAPHYVFHKLVASTYSYLSEASIVSMAWKRVVISTGQNKGEKLTPDEFNKIVSALEPLKDDFDFEFDTNVKFNTTEL